MRFSGSFWSIRKWSHRKAAATGNRGHPPSTTGQRFVAITTPGSAPLFPTLCASAAFLPSVVPTPDDHCGNRDAMMGKRARSCEQHRAARIATERQHNQMSREARRQRWEASYLATSQRIGSRRAAAVVGLRLACPAATALTAKPLFALPSSTRKPPPGTPCGQPVYVPAETVEGLFRYGITESRRSSPPRPARQSSPIGAPVGVHEGHRRLPGRHHPHNPPDDNEATKATSVRPDSHGPRGYARSTLEPIWRRLGIGPTEPGAPGEPGVEPLSGLSEISGCSGLSETLTEPGDEENDAGCRDRRVGCERPCGRRPAQQTGAGHEHHMPVLRHAAAARCCHASAASARSAITAKSPPRRGVRSTTGGGGPAKCLDVLMS